LASDAESSSNLRVYFKTAQMVSSKLATAWTSGAISTKEKLQKLVFAEGIVYDFKNEAFRTEKVDGYFV